MGGTPLISSVGIGSRVFRGKKVLGKHNHQHEHILRDSIKYLVEYMYVGEDLMPDQNIQTTAEKCIWHSDTVYHADKNLLCIDVAKTYRIIDGIDNLQHHA